MRNLLQNILIKGSLAILTLIGIYSCEKDFLLKPQGSDATVDSIFSTSQKVQAALARAYSTSLLSGLPGDGTWTGDFQQFRESTISMISGEVNPTYQSWQDAWKIARTGMTADAGGRPLTEDGFNYNYIAIRHDYLVIENIDNVSDMSSGEKEQIKAEMKALIAYRYEEMFKRYGGVPLVTKSLTVEDSIKIPRASLQKTLDFIVKLCDEAASVLPDNYPSAWNGRVTRGVALAIKAEALMYAARPLFNSSTPYLNMDASDENASNDIICFGSADQSRWQDAVNSSKAVIDWALANGYEIIDTDSPLDDYGTATSTPGNKEVLLAYKHEYSNSTFYQLWNIHSGYMSERNGMSYNQLLQYYKEDGSEPDWPDIGDAPRPYSTYYDQMQQMEARYKASAIAAGIDAWNNPNSEYWKNMWVQAGREACGRRAKFWYMAGTRSWFEYPLYRLAEFYLDLAEAYNELGQPAQALQYLNVIRDRAGLPDITETDKVILRKIIQREWRIEFYEEGHEFFDAKHWKMDDIGNGIIGGTKKTFGFEYIPGYNGGSLPEHYVSYWTEEAFQGFWAPNQYLLPFPSNEVNKGYLIQNPGY